MIEKYRRQNKKAAYWLLYLDERLSRIYGDMRRHEQISPQRLRQMERQARMIDELTEELPEEHRLILAVRRSCRGRAWLVEALERFRQVSGREITRGFFRSRWEEIVSLAAREALLRGLL